MTQTDFPKYEIMLILQPDLGEEKTKAILEEARELVKEADGKIFNEDLWGVHDLAYMIKHQRTGYYAIFNFTADPTKVKNFEKQLNINNSVLRYLITKMSKLSDLKTMAQYQLEAEEAKLKKEAEAKEKAENAEKERGGRRPERKEAPARTPIKKAAVTEEKVEEKVEKKPVKKVVKKEEPKAKKVTTSLDDVDAKLKSIIDDPDITL